ncbi:LANO_0G08394g1_1 [Lachancea nothofagi CBS 11611]|uniref:LANO_0G08394g1_1 n=1 Tax=Lachancea nothofagi CBS 11611 TaxID=1266666 RepID=A0A1G4KI14_9SACH|nr:LANO_0G08394g1_1 [Lachancea nothofagi CBS 11611]
MIQESVVLALEDANRVNYKSLWLNALDDEERQLLELFSFGQVRDVPTELGFTLSDEMWVKLKRLTLLDLCCQNRTVYLDRVRRDCELGSLLEAEHLMMSVGNWVDFQIDQVSNDIHILQCHESRDVYNGEQELAVVKPNKTGQSILKDLRQWRNKLQGEL